MRSTLVLVLLPLGLLAGSARTVSTLPVPPADRPVDVQMHNISLHVDAKSVIAVRHLRGQLLSTRPGEPPVFDDKESFRLRIDSGEVAMTPADLSHLMNTRVFAYKGAPLRRLTVTIDDRRLRITGSMKKGLWVPFTVVSVPIVSSDGKLRLQTVSTKALGIPATKLMGWLRLEMGRLIHVREDRGVAVDGNDFVIDLGQLLPPPRVEGRVHAVRVEAGALVQLFGPGKLPPLPAPEPNGNYMYYRGGTLRFGKLTMHDADLALIDAQPEDPFDFFQDHYNDQLVAGYSKNTPELGLKVYMPDFKRLKSNLSLVPDVARRMH